MTPLATHAALLHLQALPFTTLDPVGGGNVAPGLTAVAIGQWPRTPAPAAPRLELQATMRPAYIGPAAQPKPRPLSLVGTNTPKDTPC